MLDFFLYGFDTDKDEVFIFTSEESQYSCSIRDDRVVRSFLGRFLYGFLIRGLVLPSCDV